MTWGVKCLVNEYFQLTSSLCLLSASPTLLTPLLPKHLRSGVADKFLINWKKPCLTPIALDGNYLLTVPRWSKRESSLFLPLLFFSLLKLRFSCKFWTNVSFSFLYVDWIHSSCNTVFMWHINSRFRKLQLIVVTSVYLTGGDKLFCVFQLRMVISR